MGFLDRAKEAAQRAKSGARVAREQGQQRIEDLQARRQAEVLLREVGLASYEEHRGEAGHEAVVRAVAKLDEHVKNHNIDLSTSGIRGYLRTATGSGDDAPRESRTTADAGTADESTAKDSGSTTGDSSTTTADGSDSSDSSGGSDSSDSGGTSDSSGGGDTATPAKKTTAKKTTTKKTAAKKTSTAKKTTASKTSTAKKSTTKKTTAKKADPSPKNDKPADDKPADD